VDGVFVWFFPVPDSARDENGHVNNVEYVRWMQQAAVAHADAVGCSAATRAAGATWVVRSHNVEYLRPVFAGEELTVKTWVSTLGKTRSLRKYLFLRGDERVARGETLWVFVDAATGRPRAIPPVVSEGFSVLPAEHEPAEASGRS